MEISNNILIDFNMIVNTDIGIFNLIKNRFKSSECFDENILKNSDNNSIIYRSINERYDTILDLIKSQDYEEYNTINLYNELYSINLEYILKNSIITDVLNLLNAYTMSNVIVVTVLCKNKQEQQLIKNINKKFNTITHEEKIIIEEYDSIFIKHYKDILKFDKINGKNIFISNIINNMEKDKNNIPLLNISSIISKTNNIYVIDLYSNIKNPLG